MEKKQTITKRFLFYLISVIVVSNILLFSIQYLITQRNMIKQAKELRMELLQVNLAVMQQYFADIDQIADSIIYNRDVIHFMKSDHDRPSELAFLSGIESIYDSSRNDLELSFYKADHWDRLYSIEQTGGSISISDYRYTSWYQEIVWTDKKKVLLTNHDENAFIQSCIYKIEDIYSPYVIGYLKVDMDLNVLKARTFTGHNHISGTSILDDNEEILFFDKMAVQVSPERLSKGVSGTYETDDFIITYGTAESTGWHLCMAASKHDIMKNQRQMIKTLMVVLAGIVAVTLLLSNKLRMVIIGDVNQQVQNKQLLVKEAEIKALQQQINPHFIFNIMETIMGLASEGLVDEIIQVSRCVSSMLRYNTRFENETVIREELKQVKNYCMIMKIRFDNCFEVFYDVDDACMDCRILKFTLQPLVENAISHGLKKSREDGILRIRIKKEDEMISILIFDNGMGIEEDRLCALNQSLQDTWEHPLEYIDQYKSLGIMNVHLRLRLYFGEDYSIELLSKDGKGTCVSVKIPLMST